MKNIEMIRATTSTLPSVTVASEADRDDRAPEGERGLAGSVRGNNTGGSGATGDPIESMKRRPLGEIGGDADRAADRATEGARDDDLLAAALDPPVATLPTA